MAQQSPLSSDWIKNWQSSIAIKITAAVLYAVALIGFLTAVMLLHGVENDLREEFAGRADSIAYQAALALRADPHFSPSRFKEKMRTFGVLAGGSAIEVRIGRETFLIGAKPADALVLNRVVPDFSDVGSGADRDVQIRVFFPPVRETAIALRNRSFLVTLAVTLGFGLFLAWIILKFITKPFRTLINATKAVSDGDLDVRLDEARQDEFGYLSTFFNRMVSQISKELNERAATNLSLQDEIRERRRAQDEIELLRRRNEGILNSAGEGIQGLDRKGRTTFTNPAGLQMLGWTNEDLVGKYQHDLIHHTRADGTPYPGEECLVHASLEDGLVYHQEGEVFWRKDGTSFPVEYTSTPIRGEDGSVIGVVLVFRDITQRKRAEDDQRILQSQFMQAQKMESVGRLAGGVAHDFNNILSAILSFSELSLMKLEKSNPLHRFITVIRESAERAATLTQQLLAFSRKQVLEMRELNLNYVVKNLLKMLTVMIGEDIKIECRTETPVRHIQADRGQIDQILMNLAVNARDAMPLGGLLTIATKDVYLDLAFTQVHKEVIPGHYVLLSVTDTGEGMSPEIQGKLFEPFFTTKGVGKGTGLGLATVYGIVKQHNGYIYVESAPGKGSTFQVFFPATSGEAGSSLATAKIPVRQGSETVLVADDDQHVRALIEEILKPFGYRVLQAASGREALQISEGHMGEIDLLLTDVVMAEMNGRELVALFRPRHPETKVIFMSGYTDDVIGVHGVLEPGLFFLQKPITLAKLMWKLEEVLGKN